MNKLINKCTVCGSDAFTLAKDRAKYTPFIMKNGRPVFGESRMEISEHDSFGPARIFCRDCGTYYSPDSFANPNP